LDRAHKGNALVFGQALEAFRLNVLEVVRKAEKLRQQE